MEGARITNLAPKGGGRPDGTRPSFLNTQPRQWFQFRARIAGGGEGCAETKRGQVPLDTQGKEFESWMSQGLKAAR
jgi:hypothetical protein